MQVELTKKMKICDSALPLVGNIFVHERTEKKEKLSWKKVRQAPPIKFFLEKKKTADNLSSHNLTRTNFLRLPTRNRTIIYPTVLKILCYCYIPYYQTSLGKTLMGLRFHRSNKEIPKKLQTAREKMVADRQRVENTNGVVFNH